MTADREGMLDKQQRHASIQSLLRATGLMLEHILLVLRQISVGEAQVTSR